MSDECATMLNQLTLPEWLCHKRVRAAKIDRIECLEKDIIGDRELHESKWLLHHGESSHAVMVPYAFIARHKPEVGGYFVRYEDGYESYSPAVAFEGGYTRMVTS